MTGAIHQVVPVLCERDATGQHALQIQTLLRDHGIRSEIFVVEPTEETADRSHPLAAYDRLAGGHATLLYQCSVGSAAAEWCRRRPERLIVNYHNVTPARYFDVWHPGLAAALRAGRREVRALAQRTVLAICDSNYNAQELLEFGYRCTKVAPVLIDLAALDGEPTSAGPSGEPSAARAGPPGRPSAAPAIPASRAAGDVTWLFVGRVVPNKGHHDLLAAFAAWCACSGRTGRLRLVGAEPAPAYCAALRSLADRLGIADRVQFDGSIGHAELVEAYRSANVFVSLSEHEGFCIPVIEAMQLGLPVVVLGAAAVPETVAGSAIVLPTKQPIDVAAAVERVVTDGELSAELVEAGRERARNFGLDRNRARFLAALSPALGCGR